MLETGILKSKADSKPSGLVGGLHTISSDIRKGREVDGAADRTFLEQLRASSVSHSSFSQDGGHGISSSTFGIQHFASTITYDVSGFVEQNIDAIDVTAVSLLKASDDPFIGNLLSSPRLAYDAHPKDHREMVAAQISDVPRSTPSRIINLKGEPVQFTGRSSGISPSLTQLNSHLSSLFPFLDQTHVWTAYCLCPNAEDVPSNIVDFRFLKHQIGSFALPHLTSRLITDYIVSYTLAEFSLLLNKAPLSAEEIKEWFASEEMQEKTHFAVGKSRVFLTYYGFKRLGLQQTAPLSQLSAVEPPPKPALLPSPVLSPAAPSPKPSSARRPASSAAELIRAHRQLEQEAEIEKLSDDSEPFVQGNSAPTHRRQDTLATLVNTPSRSQDDYFGTTLTRRSSYTLAGDSSPEWKARKLEEVEPDRESIANLMRKGTVKSIEEDEEGITKSRLIWLMIVWFLTWWLPVWLLMLRKKYRRPDVRLAWREKVSCTRELFQRK
jgi:chitin synthase